MNDGMATATVTGGQAPFTYSWNNGAVTQSINNLVAGPYEVTITDNIGCSLVNLVVVTEPTELQSTIEGFDGACGGNASASAFGNGGTSPYTYLWSNGSTVSTVGGLTAGLYSVTITDGMGCTTTNQVQVDVNSSGILVEHDVDAVSCFGDADGAIDLAMMQGTPPFTFQWTNGASTEDIAGLVSGDYGVFITDAVGCTYFTSITVGTPNVLSVNVAVTPADNGDNGSATALISGGTAPYVYNWSTGNLSAMVDGLGLGDYSVTVTDANGCTSMHDFSINLTAIDEIESLTSFNLFPNPSNGYFQIMATFSSNEQFEIEIYSVVGQLVYTNQMTGNKIESAIDIRTQPKGTYLLRIRTEDGALVRRVFVQ